MKLPHYLLAIYIILFLILAINPINREVWLIENLTVIAILTPLILTYKKFKFSNTAYILMSVLIYLHTIGGHYTFGKVPFSFITELFDFERNHYDRIAHFSVGFYAYACAELLLRKKLINSKVVLFLFPIFFIFTIASTYEIFEWITAFFAETEAGGLFLGSQGDIWDPQKDMLANALGAIAIMPLFWMINKKTMQKSKFKNQNIMKNVKS